MTVKGPLTQSSHSTHPRKESKVMFFTVTCTQVFPFWISSMQFHPQLCHPPHSPQVTPFLMFLKISFHTHFYCLGSYSWFLSWIFSEASSPLFPTPVLLLWSTYYIATRLFFLSFYLHSPALQWYLEGTQQLFVKWLNEAEHSVLYASYTRYICLYLHSGTWVALIEKLYNPFKISYIS